MSAWDIYWVMQMDSIRGMLGIIGLGFFAIGVLLVVFICINLTEFHIKPNRRGIAAVALTLFTGMIFGVASVFLPSTKTLAAMYVLPKIADSDFVQEEAPELYDLAIERLKDELGTKEK